MNYPELVNKTVAAYLESGQRITLNHKPHDPELSIGKVFASALGLCPKNEALKRESGESKYDLDGQIRMNSGSRIAEIVQEAMLWHFGESEVEIEYSVDNNGVRGRMDLMHDGATVSFPVVTEIKWTRSYKFSPKLAHVYQLMWYLHYMNRFEHSEGFLLGIDDTFNWYELLYVGNDMYQLVKDGVPYKAEWNNAQTLNVTELERLIQLHQDYLSGKITATPMPDFLNQEGGWQCFEWEDKRKKESIIPRCPFFSQCHSHEVGPIQVEKQNKKYYIKSEDF